MLSWLVYASLGKLLIHFWMSFHIPNWLSKYRFVELLHECDMCSGTYIYTFLAFVMSVDVLYSWFGFEVFIVGTVITGILTSWLVHIFSIGFRTKYLEVIVE